jgi:hypothetical protein
MYSVCHSYLFILLFQMLAYIKLQYSILPEYTEFQVTVQQLKTKSSQQIYNFIILRILLMRLYIYIIFLL